MSKTEMVKNWSGIGLLAVLGLVVMLAVATHPMVLGFGFGLVVFMLGAIAARLERIERRMSKD